MPQDLHRLPRIRDRWTYLYLEHAQIEQDVRAIVVLDAKGKTLVPCAQLHLLLLGPGTSVSHAAMRVLVECGCAVVWTGEQGVRCYAQGMGETRSAARLLHQARLWADPVRHLAVVRAMYQIRFPDPLDPALTLQQIRGKEGIRVRADYRRISQEYGLDWQATDPINQALSAANTCLYGICHAAIVAAGYSPSLGSIHTGKLLSFVYDVADLYKMEVSVPAAFATSAAGTEQIESRVRHACRDRFQYLHLLSRIVGDLDRLLGTDSDDAQDDDYALDGARPGQLWSPKDDGVLGGVNFGDDEQEGSR